MAGGVARRGRSKSITEEEAAFLVAEVKGSAPESTAVFITPLTKPIPTVLPAKQRASPEAKNGVVPALATEPDVSSKIIRPIPAYAGAAKDDAAMLVENEASSPPGHWAFVLLGWPPVSGHPNDPKYDVDMLAGEKSVQKDVPHLAR